MLRLQILIVAVLMSFMPVAALRAQSTYDWAVIGSPGNAPYAGFSDPISPTYGRGGVGYTYAMSRTEVTSAQWVDFLNAALARPDPLPQSVLNWISTPIRWGGTVDTSYPGPGTRYRLRNDIVNAGMVPAGAISWRMGAVLCNWLNSGQNSADPNSFVRGAYDVTTFTGNFPTFGDQRQHTPGARVWIPTIDEYLKAAYFDPNGNGAGQARWWQYPNRSDTPLVYGPPPSFGGDGTGQANAGFSLPLQAEYTIPLGAYPNVQTPWGLLDVAGGTTEWLEDFWQSGDGTYRRNLDGSNRHDGITDLDSLISYGEDSPGHSSPEFGLRLATDVPTPGAGVAVATGTCVLLAGRRRRSVLPCSRWGNLLNGSQPLMLAAA